jgi:hypothetical protein
MTWWSTVYSIFNSEFLYSKHQEEDLVIEKDSEGWLQPTTNRKKEVRFSSPEETSKPYVMVDIPSSLEKKPIPRKRKSSSQKIKRHSYPPMTMAQPMPFLPTIPQYPQYYPQHQQYFQPPPTVLLYAAHATYASYDGGGVIL